MWYNFPSELFVEGEGWVGSERLSVIVLKFDSLRKLSMSMVFKPNEKRMHNVYSQFSTVLLHHFKKKVSIKKWDF